MASTWGRNGPGTTARGEKVQPAFLAILEPGAAAVPAAPGLASHPASPQAKPDGPVGG